MLKKEKLQGCYFISGKIEAKRTRMPDELRQAHKANNVAVMKAYGFSVKDMTESDCVAKLMKMYQDLTK